jgi:hypothetical protein
MSDKVAFTGTVKSVAEAFGAKDGEWLSVEIVGDEQVYEPKKKKEEDEAFYGRDYHKQSVSIYVPKEHASLWPMFKRVRVWVEPA